MDTPPASLAALAKVRDCKQGGKEPIFCSDLREWKCGMADIIIFVSIVAVPPSSSTRIGDWSGLTCERKRRRCV